MPAPQRGTRSGPGSQGARGEAPTFEKKKTVKMNPVAAIFLFVSPVLMLGVFIVVMANRGDSKKEPENTTITEPDTEYTKIKRAAVKARKDYHEAMNLRTSDDQELFNRKAEETMDTLVGLLERFDKILDPVRDQDTGQLPDEYNEYSILYQEIQTYAHDIQKTRGLGF